MKSTKLFSVLVPMCMILAMLILITSGCRKSDIQYVPVPQPSPQVQKDVFTDGASTLLSEYELKNRKSLQAGVFHSTFKGIGPMDIFKAAFSVYSSIHKYEQEKQYQQNVTEIKNSLENINNQLTELSKQMQQLKVEGAIIAAAIIDNMTTDMTAQDFSNITGYYDTIDDQGLRYYSRIQYYCQNNYLGYNDAYMATLDAEAQARATDVTNGQGATILSNAITNLSYYIIPNPGLQPNYLRLYAQQIIGAVETQGKVVTQQEAMNLYMVLENYFLQIINYQMQAITVKVNGFNTFDTLQAQHTWSAYTSLILKETDVFLGVVNYLAAGLYDYRNQEQFLTDNAFFQYGIAPEKIMNTVLARSQFIATLLYDMAGVTCPVINGSIILPYYYNTGTGAKPVSPFTLTAGSTTLLTRTDTVIKTPLPYTYWNNSSQFSPDNQWLVLNYGKFGVSDGTWASSPQTITLNGATWGNTSVPQGKITPLWYNPRDPSQTSAVKNDSCIIQFAYFAASWKWGYCMPPKISSTQRSKTYWNVVPIISSDICVSDSPVPWSAQWHSSLKVMKNYWIPATSFPEGTLFYEIFQGELQPYSDGQVWTVEQNGAPAAAVGVPSNFSVNLYVWYDFIATCPVMSTFTMHIGSALNLYSPCSGEGGPQCFNSSADILSTNSTSGTGVGFRTGLPSNSSLFLNYEYYFMADNQSNASNYYVQSQIVGQWGFNGFYSLE